MPQPPSGPPPPTSHPPPALQSEPTLDSQFITDCPIALSIVGIIAPSGGPIEKIWHYSHRYHFLYYFLGFQRENWQERRDTRGRLRKDTTGKKVRQPFWGLFKCGNVSLPLDCQIFRSLSNLKSCFLEILMWENNKRNKINLWCVLQRKIFHCFTVVSLKKIMTRKTNASAERNVTTLLPPLSNLS